MAAYKLSGIFIYPIKSLGGIKMDQATVKRRGLEYDRRWMLVSESNQFMTQRTLPQMSMLDVNMDNYGLSVAHKKGNISSLKIPFDYQAQSTEQVKIWRSECLADEVSLDANKWFSEVLKVKCKLVYMPDSTHRKVNPEKEESQIVSFADGYPFLIIGQSSLDDLNSRLRVPVPMNRFRPNLVFEGGIPYEEDMWTRFKISDASFLGVQKCGRCKVPTIDQDTGEVGKEPIQTMKSYRVEDRVVYFGKNAVSLQTGMIKMGDSIEFAN